MARIPLLLPLAGIMLAVFPTLNASETNPGATDFFGIKPGVETTLPGDAVPGAFRVHTRTAFITGGGVDPSVDWPDFTASSGRTAAVEFSLEDGSWNRRDFSLPESVAWAGACVDGETIILVGGLREGGISARVTRLEKRDTVWEMTELPELPVPLAFAGSQVMDGILYVAGGTGPVGDNGQLLSLDLQDAGAGWESRELPGATLPWMQPLIQVRKDEVALRNALYLFGGWTTPGPEGATWAALRSGFKFLPENGAKAGITVMEESPSDVFLYASTPLGPSHIIVAAVETDPTMPVPAQLAPTELGSAGFLRYHVFTDTWTAFSSGFNGPITYLGWTEKRNLMLASTDAAGTESLNLSEIVSTERHFSFLDYAVMFLYMMGLVAIGKYFASRERNTEDFFLGGRKVPWWAAGLSIYATGTSAISFMAIPAKTYSTDWLYFIGMSLFPFFTVTIAAFVFIPLLRRLELTTVMEYFDLRFGKPVRLLMSAVFVLGQVAGRMSITLLLPSIALTAVTGMNIYLCILLMGVLATIYTAVGGINAVIWTDVLQVFVLFGGALLSFGLIVMQVDGGIGSMLTLAVDDNKFNFLDLSWDFTTATIWIMFLWAASDVFHKGLGQEGLQRAFSTKGVREARRSMITCAVVALPAGFLFYGIGTALYSFYHANPQLLNPTLQTDAIFPLFIAQQLPAGIAGLVISGLFAASMSTLDTAMNSSATILVRDFYSLFRKNKGDREQLVLAKVITVICGIFGTGVALYMASFENLGSLWDMFSILLGVIGGGLGGVGMLALATKRAHMWGTLAGCVVTGTCIILVKQYTPVHFFIYGTISMIIGSITGYIFSLIIPNPHPEKDLTGLTLWTQGHREEADRIN